MKTILLILIFVSGVCKVYSQKEFNNWYFGDSVGITFNTSNGEPEILSKGALATNEGCSTISDSKGNLLFYTNGINVWNRNHQVMKNGQGLFGHFSSSQSALIVPKPKSSNIFYIFTNDAYENSYAYGFNYSIVDMNLNNGYGDITQKNIFLLNNKCESVAAVSNIIGSEVWIVTQDVDAQCFVAYLLTENGLSNTPVKSPNKTGKNEFQIGMLKFSPNGDKLAMTNYAQGNVFLYDFNFSTGQITNELIIKSKLVQSYITYGLEFSGNGKYLYFTSVNSKDNRNYLHQIDISSNNSADIIKTEKLIYNEIYMSFFGALQIGPNQKIYLAVSEKEISVIHNPNLSGSACNFDFNGCHLNGRKSQLGLPSSIPRYIAAPIDSIFICERDTLFLKSTYFENALYEWTGPEDYKSVLQNPVIPFTEISMSGEYKYSIKKDGNILSNGSIFTTIYPREKILFSDLNEIFYCNDSLELKAVNNPEKCDITWKGINSKNNTVIVKKEGNYSVYIKNENGCIDSAHVFVYKFGKNISIYEKQHDFGVVKAGYKAEFKFTIENNESNDITVNEIYIKNHPVHFELEHKTLPFIIKPNVKTEITVNFIPKFDVNIADSVVVIFSEPCNLTEYVALTGRGEGEILVDIWMPDTTADIGNANFKMPVYIKLHENGNAEFVTDISAQISFLRTLYNAKSLSSGQYSVETLKDSVIYNVKFKNVLVSNKTNNFSEFTGDILFCNENFTDVKFDKLEFSNPYFVISYGNGLIKLNEICIPEIKGIKIREGTFLSFKNDINGTQAKAYCSEAGEYSFTVYSVTGETVFKDKWTTNYKSEKYFNLSDLVNSSGLYMIRLNSDNISDLQKVTIIK